MQYKQNTKIIIDKRKLDTLFRLGVDDKLIVQLLRTGNFDRTDDPLINDNLETLVDIKTFKNWGGDRKSKNVEKLKGKNQLENQDDNQLENQDDRQVVDKDIDIDKYKDINKYKDIKYNIFLELVISCFEPNIKTEEQKKIWISNNAYYLYEIFNYCNKNFELAIIAINKCFAPLKRENMNYSYKAVLRNMSMYYDQAVKVIESGKPFIWGSIQKEIISKMNGEENL